METCFQAGASASCASSASATRYSETSVSHQTQDGLKLIDRISLAKGSKVLDLGCGTGALSRALAEHVGPTGNVVGIDPDGERIKVAKEKYPSSEYPQLQFLERDGETFPENQYDVVFSNEVLHWVEDKDAVFRHVYRNLRPQGQFACTVGEHLTPLLVEMTHLMGPDQAEKILGRFHFIPMQQYEDLAVANGFQLAIKEVEQRKYTFPNIDAVLNNWFATQQGDFDLTRVDQIVLEKFKQPYGDSPIDVVLPLHFLVFTKAN